MSEFLAAGPTPLADVRIVSVEQYGAGPWGTMQLSDLGAEVIKIEDPAAGGDVARYVPPFQEGESSLFFEAFNRGKRSVSLDLKTDAGRAAFEDLVRCSDAVFSNLRGDQPDRLRLRYADLQDVNPTIVCCSLSGFGTTGPRASEGAYDYTIQGLAGWQAITGDPDGPPIKSALSLVDFCGGYVAALAIVAGVWRARRDGRGADVDLSLFEIALAQLNYIGTWVASRGYEPVRRRNSAHQSIVPFQNVRDCRRLAGGRLPEAEPLGATLHGDRTTRPCGRRRPIRDVHGTRPEPGCPARRVGGRVRCKDDGGMARGARAGSGALRTGQRASRTRWTTPRCTHEPASRTTSTLFWGAYPRRQARSSSTVTARRRGQGRLVAPTP